MAKKAESKSEKKRVQRKRNPVQVVRIGEPGRSSAGRIEVKIGPDVKLVVEESAIRETVGQIKEVFNVIANRLRPMDDDQFKDFLKKKETEKVKENDGKEKTGNDGKNGDKA